MRTNDLNQKLLKALDDYKENTDSLLDASESNPIRECDVHDFAKQVFYTLDDFRKHIVEYLEKP
ncbi:hypothetical protein [Sporomusa sp. KB1]|jgi:hypothetical protein|uniref:hypothetical protein n=1 Tax=Sporomusa sp. KB1 TaxID=943346 RepID=UPI0011A836A7|nr:hypothetical protein [Sporomusa sp. KB1]TWH49629.1 hypothetical protein Salpa_5868 [Sporomusa sp. KB1]